MKPTRVWYSPETGFTEDDVNRVLVPGDGCVWCLTRPGDEVLAPVPKLAIKASLIPRLNRVLFVEGGRNVFFLAEDPWTVMCLDLTTNEVSVASSSQMLKWWPPRVLSIQSPDQPMWVISEDARSASLQTFDGTELMKLAPAFLKPIKELILDNQDRIWLTSGSEAAVFCPHGELLYQAGPTDLIPDGDATNWRWVIGVDHLCRLWIQDDGISAFELPGVSLHTGNPPETTSEDSRLV